MLRLRKTASRRILGISSLSDRFLKGMIAIVLMSDSFGVMLVVISG
jgi:hypothetical protein